MDLATTPGMQPPAGQTPNFDAPYNSLQIGIFISFGVTYFLATFFIGLRYFQAFKLIKKVEVDLVTITISYGVSMVYFVTMFKSITKMAILSVLYRINPSFAYRASVVAIAVAIFAYTLTLCIITGGPCSPLQAGTTKCLMNVALSQAVLNIASDLAVVAVPIPTILNLHLSVKQKVTIGGILALGSAVVVCSVVRLPYVLLLDKTPDVTYTEAILGVWSIVEVNLGIICACAMRFKRLLSTYLPRLALFSSRSRSGGKITYESDVNRLNPPEKRGKHSYQLHSIQSSSTEPFAGNKDAAVYHSYQVDVSGDSGSADKILR
ncbi:hypothetical protein FE257_002738 [Aspergillus nanangensis]|uniref:Rhodopsin domain-containing protein n=1 Tax=Aspergillus nanangensis TaxID=2582783 RepID=A0AAD4CDP9_ASPNN|nr:hypothetical protein FE257_002738 [Aspergillus nanangensis]